MCIFEGYKLDPMRVFVLILLFSGAFGLGLHAQSGKENTDSLNIAFLLGICKPKPEAPPTETEENQPFTTKEATATTFKLSEIFPNPANQEFSLSLQVDRTQQINIEILDATGKVLDRLHQGPALADIFNDFTFIWQAPVAGNYRVRILGEDFEVSKGLLIQ